MEGLDLDLNNYSLEDLLELFKIDHDFDEEDLKRCYKVTLMTHPDKSHLDKKYFLFFSKAFKILKNVYTFKNASCVKRESTKYYSTTRDSEDNRALVEKMMKKKNFNKWFNEQFDKIVDKKDNGYGEWLASDENLNTDLDASRDTMTQRFNSLKTQQRELVLYKKYDELGKSLGGNGIIEDEDIEYTSDVFSKLKFNDVKEVHSLEGGVIPVTEQDYHSRKKYASVNQMEQDRTNMNIDYEEGFREKMSREQEQNGVEAQRAYKYAKQLESMQEKQDKWWQNFKRLGQ
jgi:hypothetical protein